MSWETSRLKCKPLAITQAEIFAPASQITGAGGIAVASDANLMPPHPWSADWECRHGSTDMGAPTGSADFQVGSPLYAAQPPLFLRKQGGYAATLPSRLESRRSQSPHAKPLHTWGADWERRLSSRLGYSMRRSRHSFLEKQGGYRRISTEPT
jgi:hypothetical protein